MFVQQNPGRPALETVMAMTDNGGYKALARVTLNKRRNRTDGGDVALTHAGEGRCRIHTSTISDRRIAHKKGQYSL